MWRYIKTVEVLPEYLEVLKIKQGGSKERAKRHWKEAKEDIESKIGKFSDRDFLMIMSGIYWGEGTKKELAIINGDPHLIKLFILGLTKLGVNKDSIKLNFRIFSDMDKEKIINYWLQFLQFEERHVGYIEIIEGSDKKKLIYGMCRVTLVKGAPHFKRVMSMIDLIKSATPP